jgi:hypothetical protein
MTRRLISGMIPRMMDFTKVLASTEVPRAHKLCALGAESVIVRFLAYRVCFGCIVALGRVSLFIPVRSIAFSAFVFPSIRPPGAYSLVICSIGTSGMFN